MNLKNLDFLTEETVFENGKLYSIFSLRDEGYAHYSYYDADSKEIDTILEELREQLDLPELVYIANQNLKDFKSNMMLTGSALFKNEDSLALMKQLSAIESLNNIELSHISGNNYKVYYYPRYMIYEITSMAVKMPKQVSYDTGEVNWTFEYLIYPNFTVNKDLISELRNITGKPLPLNIENVPLNVENRGFYRPFSTSLYVMLYLEYFRQCGLSKGVTNAIRVMEHNRIAQDSLYEIYQKFRQNKKDSVNFTGYDFYGPIRELKLNDFIEAAGLTKADVGVLSQNPEKRMEFTNAHKDELMYEPIITYIQNINNSPFEAMNVYREMEWNRCYIRKMLYQLNMCWYDSFDSVISYLNMVQPSCNLDPTMAIMMDTVSWVQGGRAWGVEKHTHKTRRRKQ